MRFLIYLFTIISLVGCAKSEGTTSNSKVPQLTLSDTVTTITAISASFSSKVTSVGNSQIIEKGICFSVTQNPNVENSTIVKSSSSTTTNSFVIYSKLFSKGTTYYVRAYAKNSSGIGYSNEISFKTYGYTGQAGGLVFYDKGNSSNGWRYLEVSPVDIGTQHQWGKDSLINGANQSTFGGGFQNTIDMSNAKLNNPSNAIPTALQVIKGYSLNGYNDWYLPSDQELAWLGDCLAKFNIGGFGKNGINYWSSTQKDKTYANYYNLDVVGGGGYDRKINSMAIRAVRRY